MADQGGEGLLSPFLRRMRIAAVIPHLQGRVLDIGCGSGRLARYVSPDNYLGVDIDEPSLAEARRRYPYHCFVSVHPAGGAFDTVVALAVIEHVSDPGGTLRSWMVHVAPAGRLVLTTPHPVSHALHRVGASLGIFSRHAAEEHTVLLDRSMLAAVAAEAGLVVLRFERFLVGFNQLAVLGRVHA